MTGSQGEPSLRPQPRRGGRTPLDSPVPGRYRYPGRFADSRQRETVARTIDNLFRGGANVIYNALVPTIHVSGHGARDELRHMLDLTRAEVRLPVHGEFRHLLLYQRMAVEWGLPARACADGDRRHLAIRARRPRASSVTAPSGSVLIDGLSIGGVSNVVLRDRQHLSEDGVIFASLVIERDTGRLLSGPRSVARGFVGEESDDLIAKPPPRGAPCPAPRRQSRPRPNTAVWWSAPRRCWAATSTEHPPAADDPARRD